MKPHLLLLPIALSLAACGAGAPADPAATPADAPPSAPMQETTPPAAPMPPTAPETSASTPAAVDATRSEAERGMDATIEKLLGDPARYREAIERLQTAVADDDAAAVAALVRYPIEVEIGGRQVAIEDERAFAARYAEFMTPDIRRAVLETRYDALFVNQQGIMFGRGQVWLNGICEDHACTAVDVRIVRLQPGLD